MSFPHRYENKQAGSRVAETLVLTENKSFKKKKKSSAIDM